MGSIMSVLGLLGGQASGLSNLAGDLPVRFALSSSSDPANLLLQARLHVLFAHLVCEKSMNTRGPRAVVRANCSSSEFWGVARPSDGPETGWSSAKNMKW